MIEIDFKNRTFTCPYCGKEQAFSSENSYDVKAGFGTNWVRRSEELESYDVLIYHIKCNNKQCQRMIVVARNYTTKKQWDLIPENVHKAYPDYIPQQIRDDYVEASLIIEKSPKAAAALLRRCLQGMIHDFWDIHGKNLNAEITQIKDKISATQWKAIDGLRSIGNIGAHMEHDVNLIVDIDVKEAMKLQKLIELLLEKWYITRHDEEALFEDIAQTAENKQEQRTSK